MDTWRQENPNVRPSEILIEILCGSENYILSDEEANSREEKKEADIASVIM